jgi:hypothetical protein
MRIALAADAWWEEATHEEQVAYLKEHPKSRKKLTKKPVVATKPKPQAATKPAKKPKAPISDLRRPPITSAEQNAPQHILQELNDASEVQRKGFLTKSRRVKQSPWLKCLSCSQATPTLI